MSLKDVIANYPTMYDSYDEAFIVYCNCKGLLNMLFTMHSSGPHVHDAKNEIVLQMADSCSQKDLQLICRPWLPFHDGLQVDSQIQPFVGVPHFVYQDAGVAEKIWGPNITVLNSKTTRKTPSPVSTDMVAIPGKIRELHQLITLSINVFFINMIPFILTLSWKLCFTTVTHLVNCKINTIFKAFR